MFSYTYPNPFAEKFDIKKSTEQIIKLLQIKIYININSKMSKRLLDLGFRKLVHIEILINDPSFRPDNSFY